MADDGNERLETALRILTKARLVSMNVPAFAVGRWCDAWEAEAARRHAERPFGGDVDRLRPILAEAAAQRSALQQREADLRIGRAGHGLELVRREDAEPVAHRLELFADAHEVAAAAQMQCAHRVEVLAERLVALQCWHLGLAATQDAPDRAAGHVEDPRYRSRAVAFV